ncbi:hypothetical protein [Psychrobacter sp. PSP]|nr:hypothetical protein [Psychrobacter sp. PSP]
MTKKVRTYSDEFKAEAVKKNQTRIQKGLGYQSPRQVWFDYYRQAA